MGMQVNFTVSEEIILSLLCSAFEGGSNYWIDSVEKLTPATKPCPEDKYWHWCQWNPVNGGEIVVVEQGDDDKIRHKLNRTKLESGLCTMAKDDPRHFSDALRGNDDSITGDVYLQHCLFGKIVYS